MRHPLLIASSTPAVGRLPTPLDETSLHRHDRPCAGHPQRQSATTDGRDKPGHDDESDAGSNGVCLLPTMISPHRGSEGYRERENTMNPSRLGMWTAANVLASIVSSAAMMPFSDKM